MRIVIECRILIEKSNEFVCVVRNNIYLCNVKTKKKMIQNFTYILLCGIIILLGRCSGSECRA